MDADAPVVIVNLKAYREATGAAAVDLARSLERAARGASATVALAPGLLELAPVAAAVDLPVLAQHVDPIAPGAGTGHVTAEAIAAAGAAGSLVNHAERRLRLADIGGAVRRLADAGLTSVVCTNDTPTTAAAAALGPDLVAVEPPELIGGDVSVTKASPDVVRGAVEAARRVDGDVRVLCGAGVKTAEDLRAALDLGAHGVLLASGVVLAKDPGKALADLLRGLP